LPRIKLLPPILASIRAACAWLRRAWTHLGHRNQHWIENIAIGIAIEIMLPVAQSTFIVAAAQNWALDAAMRGYAGLSVRGGATLPLIFIDIDEESWRSQWWGHGEPFRAPRQRLFDLIDYAFEHDARYVVLDVIVEGSDNPEDTKFAADIKKLAGRLETTHQHLLFVRTLRDQLHNIRQFAPEVRPSPLDEVLLQYPGRLHAVAPYFQVSRDGAMRGWQMWRAGCRLDPKTGKGRWEILPSVQLLIATLVLPQKPGQETAFPWSATTDVESCIVDLRAFAAGVAAVPEKVLDRKMWDWLDRRPDLTGTGEPESPNGTANDLTSRIFFKFRYPPQPSQVWLIPALKLFHPTPPDEARGFAGGLVVIGQSFEAARDQHMTPLGPMPGAMVLINSVASMLDLKLLRPPSQRFECLFQLGSIVVVGLVYAYIESTVVTVVTLVPFVLLLIGMNYLLLRLGGIWLDFATPLLAIWAHRPVSHLWQTIKSRTYGQRK
jgi:CHASE2 domain-containing sensor protein